MIRLLALASPAIGGAVALLAGASPGDPPFNREGGDRPRRRPCLFYDAASLDRMRQMLAVDENADSALKKHGDELLAASLIPESADYVAPGNQITEMGLTLGLLFHLTGERRYADKLREAMRHYAGYVRWTAPEFARRDPQWHSELNTAQFGFGSAIGYDALHDVLSGADKQTFAEGMVRLAILPILNDWVLPGARIHSLDSMGHNWWGVCVAAAGIGALALLGDDPRAQPWIDAVDAGFVQWFSYPGNVLQNRMPTFERSGPSYEGVNYTNYGVAQYLHYRLAWQNTYPDRQAARMEPLEHVATYFLQTLYPASTGFYSVNFDDAPIHTDSTATVLLLIACGLGTPDASRYLQLADAGQPDFRAPAALLLLLRQHPKPGGGGEAPTSCIYSHMGWAILRSSWQQDATLLAMKSGYTWNHAHADAGSFMLFHRGQPLIIDSGTCPYKRREYSTYYRQSRAHNVILFNGAGQPEEDIAYGCKAPGRMHALIDGLGLKYVYADATGPMARWFTRNYRQWLWSGNVILVIDEVRAHAPGQMDWLLHFAGQYTADSNGGVTLKNGAAQAKVSMLYPPSDHREDVGLMEHDPDQKVPYLVFHSGLLERSRRFITAINLKPETAPTHEILEGPNYLGVRLRTQTAVEETYLNLRAITGAGSSTSIRIGDWETDAYLLHLSRAGSGGSTVQRFFISDGSYLRLGDRSHLESLSKLTVCWSQGDAMEVFSDRGSASIQLAADRPPQRVRWNGSQVATTYDKKRRLVCL